jgi:dihydrofolate reductase
MKKLKLQVQMSVDGYIAGPNGEMDWMTWDWDDQIKSYVNELTDSVDTILLGRKMTDGFISHWSSVITKPNDPSYAFAKKMMDIPKVVFSKTLNKSDPIAIGWENTVLAKGDLADEVKKLKNQSRSLSGGKDIIVYGGATFDSSLIKAGLIDEFHLFVNPAVIGNGLSIFKDINDKQKLQLIKAIPFDCGIVLLNYKNTQTN